jgi:DNA-directed RNA polymerase subunit RPC12/RpoP
LRASEQTIIGLLAIIGGIVVTAMGGIMEVYHWARLPLVRSPELEEEKWEGLLLRCKKCGKKTSHVLISAANPEKGEMEENYKCIHCGETKKIFELASAGESAKALKEDEQLLPS